MIHMNTPKHTTCTRLKLVKPRNNKPKQLFKYIGAKFE